MEIQVLAGSRVVSRLEVVDTCAWEAAASALGALLSSPCQDSAWLDGGKFPRLFSRALHSNGRFSVE